jgi:hypothetical protein
VSSYAVQNVIASVFLVALVVGLVALVRRMRRARQVAVAEELRLPQAPAEVVRQLHTAMAGRRNVRVHQVGEWHYAVLVRRTPAWAMLFGIVVVLATNREIRMDAVVFADGAGSVLQVSGSTELVVLEDLRSALGVALAAS